MVTNWPRPRINFDTDRVTIVCYPWGAGGKFLINCLGLASNSCLQHIELVKYQLMNDFSTVDKKVHIGNAINSVIDKWNDLNLGANVLTGVEEESYIGSYPSTAQYWPWHAGMDRLVNSGLLFFIDTHTLTHLRAILQVWPRANILLITKSEDFLRLRNFNPKAKGIVDYWDSIRGPAWPEEPPMTWSQLNDLPTWIRDEIGELFEWEICRFIDSPEVQALNHAAEQQEIQKIKQAFPNNRFLMLDGSMYLNWNTTRIAIEQCYDWLGLTDIDRDFIEFYYRRWIDTIKQTSI